MGRGRINASAGASFNQTKTEGMIVSGQGYTSDDLIGSVSNAPFKSAELNVGQARYGAVFGRLTYDLSNKYIVNFNFRRDGSSKFGPGRQFGNFGSVGAAWIFSEENFFKENIHFISFAKLNASYGTTGSDAVGDYKYMSRFSSQNTTVYNGIQPLVPIQHNNPVYHWQVNRKLDATLSLGFIKDRITFNVTYYRNRCDNQLIDFPTPVFTGFTSVTANSPALVQNDGWEYSLHANIIKRDNFLWSANFNTSFNRNRLLAYPNLAQSPFAGVYVIGKSLNINKKLHYIGVDPETGLYTFEDRNKDGFISTDPSRDDRYIINLNPKFLGGLGMDFSYKNLQLNLSFSIKKQLGTSIMSQEVSVGAAQNYPTDFPIASAGRNPGILRILRN